MESSSAVQFQPFPRFAYCEPEIIIIVSPWRSVPFRKWSSYCILRKSHLYKRAIFDVSPSQSFVSYCLIHYHQKFMPRSKVMCHFFFELFQSCSCIFPCQGPWLSCWLCLHCVSTVLICAHIRRMASGNLETCLDTRKAHDMKQHHEHPGDCPQNSLASTTLLVAVVCLSIGQIPHRKSESVRFGFHRQDSLTHFDIL